MDQAKLAFDRSVRTFDADGRLHVELSHISKAMVCPYLGAEIPGHVELGLDANTIYNLLRDPKELKAAAGSFNNLPLLIQHVPVSAEEPRRDLIVGTTGSDVTFDGIFLSCSLSIWDAEAIAGIESKEQAELSSAYRYTPDMTPGVFEGVPYDGVMRDIKGNHVALVDVGRAGHDVVVQDRNPFKGENTMKKREKVLAQAKADGVIAQDADLDKLNAFILALDESKEDENPKEKVAEDEDDESGDDYEDDPENPGKRRKKKVAEDEKDPDKDAPDGDKKEEEKEGVTKAAMDRAIKEAVLQTKKDMEALHVAREEVASIVGKVALDSASEVYRFALDHAKVDIMGVHPSAFRALVKMHIDTQDRPKVTKIAQDADLTKKLDEKFPGLKRLSQRGK